MDGTIVIVAQGRVPELREQLGTSEEVMTFKGVTTPRIVISNDLTLA